MSKSPFEPWWVKNAGHSDIVVLYPEEYIAKLLKFFAFCEGEAAQEGAEEPVKEDELKEPMKETTEEEPAKEATEEEPAKEATEEEPAKEGELKEQEQPHGSVANESSSTEQK